MNCLPLTVGCFKEIMTSDVPYNGQPILQLLAYKRIVAEYGERFRLLLSDGQYLHSFCVLAMQLNHLMVDDKLTANSIIKVVQYRTPMVYKYGYDPSEGRRIFVIFQLEILKPGNEVDFWIGQPVRLNPEAANNLVDVMLDSEISKEQKNDDAHDDDGIHFREFEDLDLFR